MWLRNHIGELVPISSPYPVDAQDDSGGMGLITSSSDFASVLRDLLRDTPLLLKVETVETMFIPQFQHGSPMYDGLLKQKVRFFLHPIRVSILTRNLSVTA